MHHNGDGSLKKLVILELTRPFSVIMTPTLKFLVQ